MLFSEVFGVEIFLEGVPVHVADGEIGVSIHDDMVLVDLHDLREVDNVGTVNPHEMVGQPFFHLLHGEQGDDGLLHHQSSYHRQALACPDPCSCKHSRTDRPMNRLSSQPLMR